MEKRASGLLVPPNVLHLPENTPRKPYPMNVLFIKPGNPESAIGMRNLVESDPLGLQYVAESMREMVQDVRIADDAVVPNQWVKIAAQHPPRIVGISCNFTMHEKQVIKLARQIKEQLGKDVIVVVGGQHATRNYKNLIQCPDIDVIAVGRGEQIMPPLVKAVGENQSLDRVPEIMYKDCDGEIRSNVSKKNMRHLIIYPSQEMDARPLITGDLVQEYLQYYHLLNHINPKSLETSRGCVAKCNFCSGWQTNNAKWYVGSPERTVEQILRLTADGKPTYVNFTDDLVSFAIPEVGLRIAQGLKAAGKNRDNLRLWAQIRADRIWPEDAEEREEAHTALKALAEVGLDMLLIGIESFRQEELDRVGKGAKVDQTINAIKFSHDIGVQVWGAQIVFPEWEKDQFDQRIEDNIKYGIEAPQFTIYTPLPGTVLFHELIRRGVKLSTNPEDYDFYHLLMKTKLPPEEFFKQFARLYEKTAVGPSSRHVREDLRRGFSTPEKTRDLADAIRAMGKPDYYLGAQGTIYQA